MYKAQTIGVLLITMLLAFGACAPTPAPTPALTPAPSPAPAPAPAPASTPASKPTTPQLITRDASELVLTIEDFEPSWIQDSAEPTTKEGAQSAYHVYFLKGLEISTPVVQNTTAVYPSVELAKQVYLNEIPKNISVENPQIGDECFLDISIPVSKRLVFRKRNVVVWLCLQQDMFGDVKPYAKIIEKKD